MATNDGLLDVGFAASRDGRRFERFDRAPFLPRGPGQPRTGCAAEQGGIDECRGVWSGEFDAGSTNVAVGYMDRGEEETLMIGHGSQFTHGGMDPGTPANTTVDGRPWLRGPVLSGLQLLTLRRHRFATLSSHLRCKQNGSSELSFHARRFVSLRPKQNSTRKPAAGRLLTRPLLLPNCPGAVKRLSLALNLNTGLSGSAMVTVLSTTNAELLRSILLVGNSAHLPVQFGSFGEDWDVAGSVLPPALQGTVVQLQLQLEGNAVDIYGFQFKCV